MKSGMDRTGPSCVRDLGNNNSPRFTQSSGNEKDSSLQVPNTKSERPNHKKLCTGRLASKWRRSKANKIRPKRVKECEDNNRWKEWKRKRNFKRIFKWCF